MNGARVGLLLFLAITHCSCSEKVHKNAAVYTVATDETDGFQRYIFSAHEYGINPNVLGMGKTWKGGDMSRMGGGWKVNLLKEALQPLKDDKEQIILFTDAYDVIFLNSLRSIVGKFKETGARILFGVEPFCWPKVELSEVYPNVTKGKKYLNSGIYIGYAPEVLELLERRPIKDDEDDQLFFTEAYLDKEFREKVHMQLDHTSEIIQNLNGAISEIELIDELYKESTYKILQNVVTHTRPMIVHGNGPSKIQLNAIGNYLARSWSPEEGCRHCKLGQINLEEFEEMPTVLVAIFVVIPTPFLEEQLEKVANLEYPKNRIHLFIHNNVKYHTEHIKNFTEKYSKQYLSFKEIKPTDETSEWTARDLSLDDCSKKNCDFYFAVDSVAHLDNEHTLKLLIAQNRTVVAPMMTRSGKVWSNFWGALTADGYYARAPDYMEIVHNKKRGLWNVPFISSCYLLNGTMIRKYDRTKLTYAHDFMDADMAFCNSLRKLEVFMYVTNRVDFGHLVDPESYDITRADPDMYQIFDNEEDWEARYIRPEYKDNFDPENKPMQPCPDVYWFPIVTDRFCDDLVHMMETYGQWSSGTNQDNRLEGGYEAVPTRDIHMNQVGWEKHWLYFLKRYVLPLNELVYWGYSGDPPRSLMNFVVRYRPDEQPSLRPHHDSSTYTINIALNRAGIDYEGGGCRFIRYNCSVVDTKKGWMLMHPGRLTHFHEGLLVTKGTRYIMIAFIDP